MDAKLKAKGIEDLKQKSVVKNQVNLIEYSPISPSRMG
jgi:hypothetical protein